MRGRPKKNKKRITISIDDNVHTWLDNSSTIRDKSNFFNVLAKQQINSLKDISIEESSLRDNIRERQQKCKDLIKVMEKAESDHDYQNRKLDEEVTRLKKIKEESK